MKKNIFFVSFLLLVLLSAGLYFITEYIYITILKDNKNSLKDNSLSIVEQISPEIKAEFLKDELNYTDDFIRDILGIENDYQLLFDQELFEKIISRINIYADNFAVFELKCGLKFKEQVRWD